MRNLNIATRLQPTYRSGELKINRQPLFTQSSQSLILTNGCYQDIAQAWSQFCPLKLKQATQTFMI